MKLARKHISGIKNYEPGKPIEEVQREFGLKEVIKMASNENPLGPSPKALAAIRKNLKKLNRYPDSCSFYLKRKLAKKLGIEPSNLVIGNGSDEIITLALRTFAEEGEEVIIAETTFLIYIIAAQLAKAKTIIVPMKNFRYDLDAMAGRITDKTKIIFLANPDNPCGTYVSKSEVDAFMKRVPDTVLVFFDEAYFEFGNQAKDFPDTMQYLNRKNVIITRTFSKAYGLSGLRLGYGMAAPEIIACLEKVREPFNVNLLAQAAGLAALDDKAFVKRTIANTKKGKAYFYREFEKMSLEYVPSATNFVIVDLKRDCKEVFRKMLALGVIVRDMKAWGLDTYIRVTVGTEKENKQFVNALRRVL